MRICCFWACFCLEVDFPALKFHKVKKFSKMQFPSWEISGNPSCHCDKKIPPVWFNNPASLWRRGTGIDDSCGCHLISLPGTIVLPALSGLYPREDDAKFLEFSKRAEDGPSRASRLSKNLSWSTGNPESRLGIPLRLGRVKGLAGNVGRSRAARWLRIVKAFTLFLNSWIRVSSRLTGVGPLPCCKDNSSILNCLALYVSSQQILRNSSISWQVLVRLSWFSLLLISNSPHKLIFSLWAWSAHWFACNLWDSSSRWVS